MSSVVRRAVPVAALLVCAVALPAAHARDRGDLLVAQIAQAKPTPTPGGEPPLTQRPPVPLARATPTATPTATSTPSPSATGHDELARTGADAGLVALAGLGLLGVGVGLRRAVRDGARP